MALGGKLNSKMFKKIFLIILIILGAFLMIFLISIWEFDKIKQSLPKEGMQILEEVKSPQLQEILQGKPSEEKFEILYKEFISPNKELKLKYPSDWIENKEEEMKINETIGEYGFKCLFLAQKFTGEKNAVLIIEELTLKKTEGFDEIINKMKKINQKDGWKMQVIKSEMQESEMIFEATYQKEGEEEFYSKEKILLSQAQNEETRAFLIAVITLYQDRQEFAQEVDYLIDSIQYTL